MQAKRKPLSFRCEHFNGQLLWSPSPLFGHDNISVTKDDQPEENWDKLLRSCDPVERFLEFNNPSDRVNAETGCLLTKPVAVDDFGAPEEIIEEDGYDSIGNYLVPLNLIERWGSAMGILVILLLCKTTASL